MSLFKLDKTKKYIDRKAEMYILYVRVVSTPIYMQLWKLHRVSETDNSLVDNSSEMQFPEFSCIRPLTAAGLKNLDL